MIKSLTAESILEEKGSEMHCVAPDTTISEALKVMVEKRIGALLIKEEEQIVGIWTERDLMYNTADGIDPQSAKIGDLMTKGLITAPHNAPALQLADQFIGRRLRHLLIERDGKYIGLLSAGDVLKASLRNKAEEADELNAIVHLQFYDEWKWKKKKKR